MAITFIAGAPIDVPSLNAFDGFHAGLSQDRADLLAALSTAWSDAGSEYDRLLDVAIAASDDRLTTIHRFQGGIIA